ncbi:MAG: hypothetical protein L6R41_005497 [Letrouitia leprolyta]|nr:MAG: hypothetical protein L6R41_005497 [Letrouitia leprolyta]
MEGRSQIPLSSGTPHHDDILPRQPTWSLQDLVNKEPKVASLVKYANTPQRSESPPKISPKELHHLLRLSALPLPKDTAEEEKMLKDLQSQLHFVRAIQEVHIPEHVQPLQSIRDETAEGMKEQEFTVESLAAEFEKEEVVGKKGRQRPKKPKPKGNGKLAPNQDEEWDPLALAPRTVGRYVAVNTATD